ncbi:MAG: GntR family transcriptional regulator [Ruminococcaceae bacterium]|nr:GntR family transcriptional regulator [Oscillospiraceae bacterium]
MQWKLDKDRAICPQICEQVCLRIALGEFAPGEKLLSVREVAVAAGVNPNTVQHSFEILEEKGILYSQRGSGWYAAEDISLAKDTLKKMIEEKTKAYFESMNALGLSVEETKKYVKNW